MRIRRGAAAVIGEARDVAPLPLQRGGKAVRGRESREPEDLPVGTTIVGPAARGRATSTARPGGKARLDVTPVESSATLARRAPGAAPVTSSPCIGFCRLDPGLVHCLGCARTRAEIAAWRDAPPAFLRRVWSELPARRARLGVDLHRLDWSREELVAFITRSLRAGGTWAFGDFGGASEFVATPAEPCEVESVDGRSVVARAPRAAVRFDVVDQLRALSRSSPGAEPTGGPILLAVPRVRPHRGARPGLTALGPDRDAIDPGDRDRRLYDLGLPFGGASFCLRTDDPGLIRDLDDCLGLEWPDLFARVGRRIARSAPARVVLGPAGRVETAGPIAEFDGDAPLAPIQVAGVRHVPMGPEASAALTPCATYFPTAGTEAGAPR